MATTEADGEISADYNDADIMFAQMMIPHHQQAVEFAQGVIVNCAPGLLCRPQKITVRTTIWAGIPSLARSISLISTACW